MHSHSASVRDRLDISFSCIGAYVIACLEPFFRHFLQALGGIKASRRGPVLHYAPALPLALLGGLIKGPHTVAAGFMF